jgi:hypothetical protein
MYIICTGFGWRKEARENAGSIAHVGCMRAFFTQSAPFRASIIRLTRQAARVSTS